MHDHVSPPFKASLGQLQLYHFLSSQMNRSLGEPHSQERSLYLLQPAPACLVLREECFFLLVLKLILPCRLGGVLNFIWGEGDERKAERAQLQPRKDGILL